MNDFMRIQDLLTSDGMFNSDHSLIMQKEPQTSYYYCPCLLYAAYMSGIKGIQCNRGFFCYAVEVEIRVENKRQIWQGEANLDV